MSLQQMVELLDMVGKLAQILRIGDAERGQAYWLGAKEMFEAMAKAQGATERGVKEMIELVEARYNLP